MQDLHEGDCVNNITCILKGAPRGPGIEILVAPCLKSLFPCWISNAPAGASLCETEKHVRAMPELETPKDLASESDGFGTSTRLRMRREAEAVAIREAGSGRRFFYLPYTVGGLVVVYPGRATDGDAGEQHMCSATCGFVGPWMDPTPRFQKIHGRVGEK